MKIVIVSAEFPPGPGGIGTHAYQLASLLTDFGHSVTVVCRQAHVSNAEYAAWNREQPFDVVHLTTEGNYAVKSLRQITEVLGCIARLEPDMVVATGARMVWSVALASLRRRFQWVAIGHGTEFGFVRSWEIRLTRWAFQRADGVVCVSNYTRNFMESRDITPTVVEVIPNGADEGRFVRLDEATCRAYRASLGLGDEANILITVGNVTPRKGQEVVIRALPSVLAAHPNTVYLMVGLPTKRDEYTALADQLGVGEQVRFMGRLSNEDLLKALNSADIFVMTSRLTKTGDFEGYGIAVVEAAFCGLPAVVSGDSGLSEAIIDGETGLEVPQNDPAETGDAICRLLADDHLRRQMGEQAAARAHDEQTWTQRVRDYERFLLQIVEE